MTRSLTLLLTYDPHTDLVPDGLHHPGGLELDLGQVGGRVLPQLDVVQHATLFKVKCK